WDIRQGNIGMGVGTTLLVKLSPTGNIVAKKSFPGRIANCSGILNGHIVSVDDPQTYNSKAFAKLEDAAKVTPEMQKAITNSRMRLRSWSKDLQLAWTVPLSAVPPQGLPMSIAAAPAGGVV